jgi:hypothetical protein
MDKGQTVEVREYGGKKLIRKVIAERGAVVVICNQAEYDKAIREGREPEGIGFPRSAVRPLPCHGEKNIA